MSDPIQGELVPTVEEFKSMIPAFEDERMQDYLAFSGMGYPHEKCLFESRVTEREFRAWMDDRENGYFRYCAKRPHQQKRDYAKQWLVTKRVQLTYKMLELDERSVDKVRTGEELSKDEHELLKARAKEFLPSVVNRDDHDSPTTQNNTIVVVL